MCLAAWTVPRALFPASSKIPGGIWGRKGRKPRVGFAPRRQGGTISCTCPEAVSREFSGVNGRERVRGEVGDGWVANRKNAGFKPGPIRTLYVQVRTGLI